MERSVGPIRKGGNELVDPSHVKMKEFIDSQITIKPKMKILDLGCGQGFDLNRLSRIVDEESRLIGIDSMEKSIGKAIERYGQDTRMQFLHGDFAQGIPFEDGSFDLVY